MTDIVNDVFGVPNPQMHPAQRSRVVSPLAAAPPQPPPPKFSRLNAHIITLTWVLFCFDWLQCLQGVGFIVTGQEGVGIMASSFGGFLIFFRLYAFVAAYLPNRTGIFLSVIVMHFFAMSEAIIAIFFPFFQDSTRKQIGTQALFMPTMIMASIASIVYFICAIILRRRYINHERKLRKHDEEMTIRTAIADEQGLSPREADSIVVPLNQSQMMRPTVAPTYAVPEQLPTPGNPAAENLVASRIENLESKFGDLVDQLRLIAQQQLELSQLSRSGLSQGNFSSSSSSSLANSKLENFDPPPKGEAKPPSAAENNDESAPQRRPQRADDPEPPFLDAVVQFPVGSTSYLL